MLQRVSDLIKDTPLLSSQEILLQHSLVHEAWKNVYGLNLIKQYLKIKQIKQDTIYFIAASGIWAQEAQLRNNEIIKKINAKLYKKTSFRVKSVVILVDTKVI